MKSGFYVNSSKKEKASMTISQVMGKTRISIKGKINNLGLKLNCCNRSAECSCSSSTTTTSLVPIVDSAGVVDPASVANPDLVEEVEADLKIKRPLPSIEEKMRELDDASKALHQKGLSPTEIKRLSKIIDAAKVYNQLFEKYAHYRDLENELMELRRQLAAERSKK